MPPVHRSRAQGQRTLVAALLVNGISLVLSVLLHLGAAAPYMAWKELNRELDSPGDEGPEDAPVGNDGVELVSPPGPVQVSLYKEKAKPRPKPKQSAAAVAPAEPEPEPESGSQDEPPEVIEPGALEREGITGKPPRGQKKPCEQIEEIVQINDTTWRIERDLLDWYAGHLRQLEKEVGVASHRGPDGKRDGARLYLPRCSVLKQGGLRNRDVINRVNGKKVNTIPQGVATWLAVRNDRVLKVELTRKDGTQLVHKYRLK